MALDDGSGASAGSVGRGDDLVSWGLAVALVAPSLIWVMKDRSVWSWDPAFYAMDTLDLWGRLLAHQHGAWLERMQTIYSAKAPGVGWLGQFFVPLGRWLGSIELGLLLSILATQAATLGLLHRVCKMLAPARPAVAVVGTVMVGGSPLFIAMSHHFLTEALQLFSVVYLLWVVAGSDSRTPLRTALHLVLALALGAIAKISTPAFVLLPAGLGAARLVRAARRKHAFSRPVAADAAWGLVTLLTLGLGGAWYLRNGRASYAFDSLATSSEVALDYGHRGPLLAKASYWLGAIGRALFVPPVAWLFAGLMAVGLVVVVARRRAEQEEQGRPAADHALTLAAVLQVVLVVGLMSASINEETRYLLPLAPMLALALAWLLASLRSRRHAVAALAVFVVQWAVVQGRQLGLVPAANATYWEKRPEDGALKMRELERVVARTCNAETAGKWSMVGVDFDWLNHYTLAFYANKAALERGYHCYYQYLGHAPRDADAAYRRIAEVQAPFFISVAESALPQPPDFLNRVAAQVLRRAEGDPAFVRVPFESVSGVVLLEHPGAWREPR